MGLFPVRGWRRCRLQAGRGAPPRAADGRGRRGVGRTGAVLGGPVFAPQAVAASGALSARVMITEEVKSSGRIPCKEKIAEWIRGTRGL